MKHRIEDVKIIEKAAEELSFAAFSLGKFLKDPNEHDHLPGWGDFRKKDFADKFANALQDLVHFAEKYGNVSVSVVESLKVKQTTSTHQLTAVV